MLAWTIPASAAMAQPPSGPIADQVSAVNAIDRLPARTSGFPFERRDLALKNDRTASGRHLPLDGDGHFAFVADADKRPMDFWREDFGVSSWKAIPVSSIRQAQGCGQPRHDNVTYPFPANRPPIRHDIHSVGSYRRDFTLPATPRLHPVPGRDSRCAMVSC